MSEEKSITTGSSSLKSCFVNKDEKAKEISLVVGNKANEQQKSSQNEGSSSHPPEEDVMKSPEKKRLRSTTNDRLFGSSKPIEIKVFSNQAGTSSSTKSGNKTSPQAIMGVGNEGGGLPPFLAAGFYFVLF
jgi:hypothetical protein